MVLKSHKDLEMVIPNVGEYEVAVLTAASAIFTLEAPILYLGNSCIEIDLYKDHLICRNDFLVWSFYSEKGWELLGLTIQR